MLALDHRLIFGRFPHNIERPAFGLIIDPANVFTQDAHADQLHAAQEKHGDQCSGLAKEGL